ncbi:hypothetical protein [Bradyrhizobium elkanii]|uniref:hypothetical protein n=1 Tax=Bradyrhizobium elkanii TaxID=29448 RepID=UPI001BA6FD2A|nr:hypothetical protein [Bradyrhizobium elkanii]MBR1163858.1 hypothetical protein [Bradyrhizobium elkanii]
MAAVDIMPSAIAHTQVRLHAATTSSAVGPKSGSGTEGLQAVFGPIYAVSPVFKSLDA